MALYKGNQNLKLPDFEEDVHGDNIFYEGNPNLKKGGHKLPYTIEHLEEYERCKEDIYYFAENYYYILDLDIGQIKIKLRDYQKEMLDSFVTERNTIVNATRQCVRGDTFIKIRNKKSGIIIDLSIEEFFAKCSGREQIK